MDKAAKNKSIKKARRRLAEAQLKFEQAQEAHAEARERGKQVIQRARLKAATWQAKTSRRLERRAAILAAAETKLLELTGPAVPTDEQAETAASPEMAAELLEQRQEMVSIDGSDGIVLPGAQTALREPNEDMPYT
jgi:hypothetical protein